MADIYMLASSPKKQIKSKVSTGKALEMSSVSIGLKRCENAALTGSTRNENSEGFIDDHQKQVENAELMKKMTDFDCTVAISRKRSITNLKYKLVIGNAKKILSNALSKSMVHLYAVPDCVQSCENSLKHLKKEQAANLNHEKEKEFQEIEKQLNFYVAEFRKIMKDHNCHLEQHLMQLYEHLLNNNVENIKGLEIPKNAKACTQKKNNACSGDQAAETSLPEGLGV